MPGKFWNDQKLAICGQNFDQNWHFWEVLTHNFQTLPYRFLEIVALTELASVLCARKFSFIGLSALAVEAYGFTLVRPSVRSFVRPFVRDAISGDPRIRFFWNFAQSCILARQKKCSKRIFEKNSRFRDFGQKWPILPFLAIFSQKIRWFFVMFCYLS